MDSRYLAPVGPKCGFGDGPGYSLGSQCVFDHHESHYNYHHNHGNDDDAFDEITSPTTTATTTTTTTTTTTYTTTTASDASTSVSSRPAIQSGNSSAASASCHVSPRAKHREPMKIYLRMSISKTRPTRGGSICKTRPDRYSAWGRSVANWGDKFPTSAQDGSVLQTRPGENQFPKGGRGIGFKTLPHRTGFLNMPDPTNPACRSQARGECSGGPRPTPPPARERFRFPARAGSISKPGPRGLISTWTGARFP